MSYIPPAAGPPSASGVRRGGDSFQDLFVWGAAMQVIRPGSPYSHVEVEINGVGNFDDVVLRSTGDACDVCSQVKWATNTADLLDEDFLFAVKKNGKSLLQKLYNSYVNLRAGGVPILRLITNRSLDAAHPLLGKVDGRTDLLVPHAAQAGAASAAAKKVAVWGAHVGASREGLLEMLGHLQFWVGRTITAEREHVRALMVAAGLDDSDTALQHGLNTVADWVVGGKRVVSAEDIRTAVDGLRRAEPSAILSVQAIDDDPHADEADVAVRWVDLFDGDQPWGRIQPRDPSSWQKMDREVAQAAETLEQQGWHSTLVRGAMRQATFFRVGVALPAVRQHTLRYRQGQQLWSTDAAKAPIETPRVHQTQLDLGDDLAAAVGVTLDPTAEVTAYLRTASIPANRLITVTPSAGPDDQSVSGAGQAVAYAEQIRNLVRAELARSPGAERIHLFLAGPGGLALLLGHRWNRTRQTLVYEHLGVGRGYTLAFTIDA